MRYISPSWAIALGVAAALTVIVWLGMSRFGTLSWLATRLAYLLAGGMVGFLALAIPPALPAVVFLVTILVGMALRDQRVPDVALLMIGAGSAWTMLLGWGILNDLADPAVYGTGDDMGWFVGGSAVLLAGLLTLIVHVARKPAAS